MKFTLFILLFLIVTQYSYAQSVQKLYNKVFAFYEKKEFEKAIELGNAILTDSIRLNSILKSEKENDIYYLYNVSYLIYYIYNDTTNSFFNSDLALGYLELSKQYLEIIFAKSSTLKDMLQSRYDSINIWLNKKNKISNVKKINNNQSEPDIMEILITGQGETIEIAKQNALRNAIEQAFGTFVSSKSEMLNDSLIKDEILSLSNGNIQKYDVISEIQIPDGSYMTSLKAVVSLKKLTSFVESKGGIVDLKGGVFSYNVKKEEFYNKTEFEALEAFVNTRLKNQIFYDYTIESKPPKVDGDGYSIDIEVGINANNNLFSFFSELFNFLENISLNSASIEFRKESNLPVFQIEVFKGVSYFIRNSKSFDLISNIDKLLYLKLGDFNIITNPKYNVPSSDFLIKSKVVANNFIIIKRERSPNPGVYWSWLPYEYSSKSEYYNENSYYKKNSIVITTSFLKNIPKQSELNRYSDHMSSIINNNRVDFNLIIGCKLFFTRNDFEKLNSIEVSPVLNNLN